MKIYFDGTLIDSDNYISFTNDFKQFDESFMLGTNASNTITIEVPGNIAIPTNVLIKINEANYATMIVDSYEYEDNNILKLNLADKMVLLDFNYNAQSIVPCTVKQILQDICTQVGITLATNSFTNDGLVVDYYDNTITAREYVGMIAELNGGFARINVNGELELVKFNGTPINMDIDTCEDFGVGEKHKIERVVFDDGILKYETSSDETLETLYLNSQNVYINDETTFNNIASQMLNFEFYCFSTGNCEINPSVRAGDLINFTDGTNNYPTIAQYSLNYIGGLNGGYELNINSRRQEETKIVGLGERYKRLNVKLDRGLNELSILAETTEEIQKEINPTDTASGSSISLEDSAEAELIDFELEGKTTQATSESPIMPSPEFSSELVSVGYQNIFTGLVKGIGLNSTTGAETVNENAGTSDFIKVDFNTNPNYYLSGLTNTIRSYVSAYNSNKQFLGRTGATRPTQWSLISTSFTSGTPQGSGDVAYLRVTQYAGSGDSGTIDDIDNLTVQLETGNTPHSYIPYGKFGIEVKISDSNNTAKTYLYTLDQPLRSIDDTKDLLYIKNNKLYAERKIESIIFNGSENWGYASSTNNVFYIRKNQIPNYKENGSLLAMSNYFTNNPSTNINGNANADTYLKNGEFAFRAGSTQDRIYFKDTSQNNNVDNFTNWLSTHNTEAQYILAEPYTEEIGQVDIPSTYKGITHVNTTDELEPNMSITYVRDTQISNYVEQHISEIKVNEQGITQRVESIENNGLEDRVSTVETNQSADRYTIDIISQNITYKYDESGKPISSEINSVKTSRGFTFDDNGLDINTGANSFHTTIDEDSTDYKDGDTIVSTTSKDGSALRMLRMLEQNHYSYNDSNPDNILDTSNYDFIDERIEVDGEYAYATFYNGED